MKYEDLPYTYKNYGKELGWTEEQALEYWHQGLLYREYACTMCLKHIRSSISQRDLAGINTSDTLLIYLRGSRASIE